MATTLTTNSKARKAKAHKAGKCQLCGEKTTGYSVVTVDGVVKRVKAREGRAFYCKDHADKKVKVRQWKLDRNGSGSKAKAKKATKAATKPKPKRTRKPKAKAAAKPKAKRTAKAKATPKKRAARKAKASTAADPF